MSDNKSNSRAATNAAKKAQADRAAKQAEREAKFQESKAKLAKMASENPILRVTLNAGAYTVPDRDKIKGMDVSAEEHKQAIDVLNTLKSSTWMQGGKVNSYRATAKGKGCLRTEGTKLDKFASALINATVDLIDATAKSGDAGKAIGLAYVLKRCIVGTNAKGQSIWGFDLEPSFLIMSAYCKKREVKITEKRSTCNLFAAFKADIRAQAGLPTIVEAEEVELSEEQQVEAAMHAA